MTLVAFLASLGVRLTHHQKAACKGFEEGMLRAVPPAPRSSKRVLPEDQKVLVCDVCFREACASGDFYCEAFRTAGTLFVNRADART